MKSMLFKATMTLLTSLFIRSLAKAVVGEKHELDQQFALLVALRPQRTVTRQPRCFQDHLLPDVSCELECARENNGCLEGPK